MGSISGEIPVGDEQEHARISDTEAIEDIQVLLDNTDWDADTAGLVAIIVRKTGRFISEQNFIADKEALDRIAGLMTGVEWDSDLPCEVADVVRATGRKIDECL